MTIEEITYASSTSQNTTNDYESVGNLVDYIICCTLRILRVLGASMSGSAGLKDDLTRRRVSMTFPEGGLRGDYC